MIPTAHIEATNKNEIAKTVLMPGDPLRAKFIAENFLTDVKQYNKTRNMLGFTGKYKGVEISVQGSGMGMPSIGIYSFELFNFYNVENIIRVGTAGGISPKIKLRDIVIAQGASTNSNYAVQYGLPGTFAPLASYNLLVNASKLSEEKGINYHVGNILSSDIFYNADTKAIEKWRKMGILAIEMEAAALYMNAAKLGKNALTILTISDIVGGEETTAEERERGFETMVEISLETTLKL
ncbi:MAG: purine-nucleoside phosphorylase [Defluviitaleaceae bacterium]|nr:purine-nucleoside phosphorylase [Defluviitaleaceae bacterium]